MPLLVPKKASELMLRRILKPKVILKLYKNKHNPTTTDTTESFEEATNSGYSPVELDAGMWDIKGGMARHIPVAWHLGRGKIYGYYVTDTCGRLLWCEKFREDCFKRQVMGLTVHTTSVFPGDAELEIIPSIKLT